MTKYLDSLTPEEKERFLSDKYKPGAMNFVDTRILRGMLGPNNKEWQRRLALEDRRSFAREQVAENPLYAVPLSVMVPGEMAYKAARHYLGKNPGGRSGYFDPLANIGAGWTGIGQGMLDFFKKKSD